MPGTVLAGDGLVVEISAPSLKCRGNIDLSNFRNRHGYYAVVCQAFCDVHTRFKFFEVSWPGSTSDITAYKQTSLYSSFCDSNVPSWAHIVLEEIYSSVGGNQHLTPFSRNQLRNAKTRFGDLRYQQMKAFNNCLSGQRITIERSFGMMLRKYAILAGTLSYNLEFTRKIILCCATLHNTGVNRWLRKGGIFETGKQSSDVHCFNTTDDVSRNIDRPDYDCVNDDYIRNYMNNLVTDLNKLSVNPVC